MPEEAPAPAPASSPATGSGKKSNATLIIIIVVVVLLILGVGGYFISRYLAQKAAEQVTEGLLGAATGSNVDVDSNGATIKTDEGSLSVGSNASWPSDMPSEIPKLTYGKISASSSSAIDGGKTWSVVAEEITQANYDAYKAKFTAAGFTAEATSTSIVIIDQYQNGKYSVSLAYDPSSKGLTLGVTPL